jgi:hypothetical protein
MRRILRQAGRSRLRGLPVIDALARRAATGALTFLSLALLAGAGLAQNGPSMGAGANVTPTFTIWDVKLGQPVSTIPDADVVNVSCGTDGGPPSLPLKNFGEYAKCPAEPSGLRDVYFQYDDEQTYIAKAMNAQDRYLQAGTSVYAHPVIISVLVDDKGIARGIRIVTDDHASNYERRSAASLETNLRARFNSWNLDCQKLQPADGEEPVGSQFVHDLCTGTDTASGQSLRLEARYMRLKGQTAIDPTTQKVTRGNYFSATRFELVQAPFKPSVPAAPAAGPATGGDDQ